MDAQQMFREGDLAGAIDAQQTQVKSSPTDAGGRTFLFELLAFAGELDRAKKQLDVLGAQDVERDAVAQTYHNILQAESQRRRVFEEGIPPQFFLDVPPDIEPHLKALQELRGGKPAEAMSLISAAEDERPEITGHLNEVPFEGLRDADDVLAPVLEVFLGPDYHWLPFSQVRQLEVAPPQTPRDLLWAACQIVLSDGTIRRGYLPALYPGSHEYSDDQVRLGRLTEWTGEEGAPVRGVGCKMVLAGDTDMTLLEIRALTTRGGDASEDESE